MIKYNLLIRIFVGLPAILIAGIVWAIMYIVSQDLFGIVLLKTSGNFYVDPDKAELKAEIEKLNLEKIELQDDIYILVEAKNNQEFYVKLKWSTRFSSEESMLYGNHTSDKTDGLLNQVTEN